MSKPNQPRDIKPSEQNIEKLTEKKSNAIQMLVINIITTTLVCCAFIYANYYIQNSLLTQKLMSSEEVEETINEDIVEKGIIYDLGEFTLNLSDTASRRYLKAAVTLELTRNENDILNEEKAKKGSGGHGGHGGGSEANSQDNIEKELSQYKAAMRDSIINVLSSKTSEELLSVTGKEVAKEQIAHSIDAILAGEREVIRVSFGQFIMQ